MSLRRSNDRKTANIANKSGKLPLIANAFGLPAGNEYSCGGMTSICGKVCYANKLEKLFPSMRALLLSNWEQLRNADIFTMISLIMAMILEFSQECDKRGAPKQFRIHWDGDFFSVAYARAWAFVIRAFPDVQFWVYTRSFTPDINVIEHLVNIPNLALYLSVDHDNEHWAREIIAEYPNVMVAALSDTMDNSAEVITELRGTNKPGAKCPELIGALPLITVNGGACFSCQLCPQGKADIRFASSKAGRV